MGNLGYAPTYINRITRGFEAEVLMRYMPILSLDQHQGTEIHEAQLLL